MWNTLNRLGRPICNSLEQSFRPAVSASGAPTAHRRRFRQSYRISCVCAYPVLGPVCNIIFFRGLVCNLDAEYIMFAVVKKTIPWMRIAGHHHPVYYILVIDSSWRF
jgi:hypothetical protein